MSDIKRFWIRWVSGQYKVSIPNLDDVEVVDAESFDKLQAENEALTARVANLAEAIHYPACWDTVAYPTLLDAIENIGCNECDRVKLEQSND